MTKKKYSILYIDDEESNLRIFKNTFRRDFNIFTANSAQNALEMLKEVNVDVLITDQRMPGMSGTELLKEVKKCCPDIPPNRLMISGYSAPGDIEDAFNKYDLYRFIPKPWKEEELKTIIINAIQNSHG
jgi:DNA-binding NtrC family response regulator